MLAGQLDSTEVVSMLRQRRVKGQSLRPITLNRKFPSLLKAAKQHFSSYEQALAVAEIPLELAAKPVLMRWNREKVVQRLQERAAKGKELNIGAISTQDHALTGAIMRHFGGHDAALAAAGFDPATIRQSRPWTKEQVVAELQKRHRNHEDLSNTYLNDHVAPLYGAMHRLFGTMPDALRAAGIDPESVKRPTVVVWPTERIIREIQNLYETWWRDHPRTEPPRPRFGGPNQLLACAARKRFGTLSAALTAAGIEDPTYHRNQVRTPQFVLDNLRKMHREGTVMSNMAIEEADLGLARSAMYFFGSIRAAVQATGLRWIPRPGVTNWTKKLILSSLRKLHRNGLVLSHKSMIKTNVNLAGAAKRHFGSVRNAVKAANLPFVVLSRQGGKVANYWTEELVLRTLKEMHQKGEDLRFRTMRVKRYSLFWAAKDIFGSYTNALEAAGINYWTMSQAQLAIDRGTKRNIATRAK
jgi:hypothetical protein